MRFYLVQVWAVSPLKDANNVFTNEKAAINFVKEWLGLGATGNVSIMDIDLNQNPEFLVTNLLEGDTQNIVEIVNRMEILAFELFVDKDHPNRITF